jgi:uncharacterized membrane protein YccC
MRTAAQLHVSSMGRTLTELSNALFATRRLEKSLRAAGPRLLFGVRLWASVCLALYVAFWLELDNPSWAGLTAVIIVCQPQLGGSLGKSWFRTVGTVVGSIAIVVLTACFPQDRVLFLISLALWGAACAFASTILRNFASYAAALAGYTAVIVASSQLGATGGLNGDAFMLALSRVTEISIGIVSADIVRAGTDLGGARRGLATLLTSLAAEIMTHLTSTLLAGPRLRNTQPVWRDLLRRIITLDPITVQALGESSQIRYHWSVLQRAVGGLFAALAGSRAVANHLVRLPDDQARAEADAVLQCLPPKLKALLEHPDPARWTADPTGLRWIFETGARGLIALPAGTPTLRLLADNAADALMGISDTLNGVALLVDEPARPVPRHRGISQLYVPDWLPALVNAGRAFVAIGVVSLFWIVTVWPSGAQAITFTAIGVILFASQADQAYASAAGWALGTALDAVFAAVMVFAVLPGSETFAAFAMAMGVCFIPIGALAALPWQSVVLIPMAVHLLPLIGPTNPMSYDALPFYNTALGIVAGTGASALFFRLIPPLSPAFRTRRLQALTLRDLRRLAVGRTPDDWAGHMHDRLSAMPEQATPLQREEVLAALSVWTEIIRLRPLAHRFGHGADLESAVAAVAQGSTAIAIASLGHLDEAFAIHADTKPEALRGRASILALSEVLTHHAAYFDAGAPR